VPPAQTLPEPDPEVLAAVESAALAMAREAGAAIAKALGARTVVSYKDEPKPGRAPLSVVSDVDHAIEQMLRERIDGRFPSHGVVGEESEAGDASAAWLWVIDPIDGTANFVNGYPQFACSIGVLFHGEPVVGAIWCSASHALTPGVYHARCGAPLRFEGIPYVASPNPDVQRRLAALPAREATRGRAVDARITGSAATDCAFVAAGTLRFALLRRTRLWDAAGGVALVRAAGLDVLESDGTAWHPFERFAAPTPGPETGSSDRADPTLRDWRGSLLLGHADPEEMPAP
jgi:myo-inositol-1(or 4)-monophosphatase